MRPVPISECFGPTIQGEGSLIGMRTMFVRTAYCDGAGKNGWCSWCDSLHAVNPKGHDLDLVRPNKEFWTWMDEKQIASRLRELSRDCKAVTFSGGNPALHDLTDLAKLLRFDLKYKLYVETQGTIYKPWLNLCHTVTVSPKPPSAGSEVDHSELTKFFLNVQSQSVEDVCPDDITMKIVVDPDNEKDYDFAVRMMEQYRQHVDHMYLSTLTKPTDTTEELLNRWNRLVDLAMEDEASIMDEVGILPQSHVLLWGHRRGV